MLLRFLLPLLTALSLTIMSTAAQARPLVIGGEAFGGGEQVGHSTHDVINTYENGGAEWLPVWTLPKLGVAVRNDANDLRLVYDGRELRYSPKVGWQSLGFRTGAALRPPQQFGPSLHVDIGALAALGLPMQVSPDQIVVPAPTAQPVGTLPPSLPPTIANSDINAGRSTHKLVQLRHNLERHRTVQAERVVLELETLTGAEPEPTGAGAKVHVGPFYQVSETTSAEGGVLVNLPYLHLSEPRSEILPSGHVLLLEPVGAGAWLWLLTGKAGGGHTRVFTLQNPTRVVLDTVRYADKSLTPPPNPRNLPAGVRLTQQGRLSLLSFDPQRYKLEVATAPWGQRWSVPKLVESVGGVAGINGGYFAMDSGKPVDLVVQGGQMRTGSLEYRAALGIVTENTEAEKIHFGYPAPRYVLRAAYGNAGQSWRVNQMTPNPHPQRITGWVGDGRSVGGSGYTTLVFSADGKRLLQASSGTVKTKTGQLYFTFSPSNFTGLSAQITQARPLRASLDWGSAAASWNNVTEALAAGPLLLSDGQRVLAPARERFNTSGSIWRRTSQSAFGLLGGWPTFAYMQAATPEELAAALQQAGLSDALRLDSGGSASTYIAGGYAGLGGYLNPKPARNVANALVIVPK